MGLLWITIRAQIEACTRLNFILPFSPVIAPYLFVAREKLADERNAFANIS